LERAKPFDAVDVLNPFGVQTIAFTVMRPTACGCDSLTQVSGVEASSSVAVATIGVSD
jgi:hypothetical protein